MVSKKFQKRPFLRRTAANALHPHPPDAHSATHRSHPGFFIKDKLSGHRCLVDTGAFRSILPPSRDNYPTLQLSSAALVAANSTSIQTYGEQEVNIRLTGQTYNWTFIIADVRHPLLGADFLSHYSLVVDVARHRLLNTDTYTSVPLCISNVEENINLLSSDDTYSDIINDFEDVFKPELRLSTGAAAKHGVKHYIKTNGPPVHSRYRRLRPELHQIAKDAFTEMEKMGVCSKAASPWASPLHMTPKKDGTWRPCGDYKRLNLITEPDHYAMPNISDLTYSISTSRVFSKLVLLKGYFQVPVNPDDGPKTAITNPIGTYVFHYSTFGLRNSGATFQLYLITDASNIAIGAVLERCNDGHRQQLGFFSRQLSAPQRNYSTFDREILAVHAAIDTCSKVHLRPSVCRDPKCGGWLSLSRGMFNDRMEILKFIFIPGHPSCRCQSELRQCCYNCTILDVNSL